MGTQLKKPTKAALTDKLDALRAIVAVMRELGVVSYEGLFLGPEPSKAPKKTKPDEEVDAVLEERRSYYEEVLGRKVNDAELRRLP